MQHFTERFKGQLVKMATGEVDISVRISAIHALRLIDRNGLLDVEQREEIATLIFEEEKRVRQAVSGFFSDLLNEKVEEKNIELSAGNNKGSAKKKGKDAVEQQTHLEIKCLAELLVNYGKALDGELEEENQDNDEDANEGSEKEPQVNLPKSHSGRIALAIEALWEEVEPIRNWEAIMNFLLLDHSTDGLPSGSNGNDGGTPKGKGRAAKKAAAKINLGDDLDDACKLTEGEETLLVEVLVASLGRITSVHGNSKKVSYSFNYHFIKSPISKN